MSTEEKPKKPSTFEQVYAETYPEIEDIVKYCPHCGAKFISRVSANVTFNCPNTDCTKPFHVRIGKEELNHG